MPNEPARPASQGQDGVEGGGSRTGPPTQASAHPLPPSPSSERKVGLGFSHGLTAVTGYVSLNYRDTMCINRVIAPGLHPLGQTARGVA